MSVTQERGSGSPWAVRPCLKQKNASSLAQNKNIQKVNENKSEGIHFKTIYSGNF